MTKASDANGNYIALSNSATHVFKAEYRTQNQSGNWSNWEYFCNLTAPDYPACNTTLQTIDELHNFPSVSSIQGYEFKYTNQTTNIIYSNTGPNKSNRMTKASDANGNYIALSNSATHVLRAEYRVQYQNGNWSDWEYFCDITAPSIPTCNTSLNQIDDLINYPAKKPIPTEYEFKYTNQTSNIVYTNLRPNRSTRLTWADDASGNFIALSNSAEDILIAEYRVKQNGNWSAWEYYCDFTAPSIPTCNRTLLEIDELINYPKKSPVPSEYQYKYTNQTSNIEYTNLRPNRSTRLTWADDASGNYIALSNSADDVLIAEYRVKQNGNWSAWEYFCDLTAPSIPDCDISLTTIDELHYFPSKNPTPTRYQMKFTNQSNTSLVYTNERANRASRLIWATDQNTGISINASNSSEVTFTAEFRVLQNGNWSAWEYYCDIITPPQPSNMIISNKQKSIVKENLVDSEFLNNDFDYNLKIFPNPNNGENLFINGQINKTLSKVKLQLFDLNGKLISETQFEVSSRKFEKTWNFNNNLTSGIYLLKAQINQDVINKKLIVQK